MYFICWRLEVLMFLTDGIPLQAPQQCTALPGILCQSTCNSTFTRWENCNWTNGYQFDTALLLSVFLGMFGIDRFYLGYPAIGLLKFSTLGFFFIGHLVDIILIASQTLGPADGSHYIINYFGAGKCHSQLTNNTLYIGISWYKLRFFYIEHVHNISIVIKYVWVDSIYI